MIYFFFTSIYALISLIFVKIQSNSNSNHFDKELGLYIYFSLSIIIIFFLGLRGNEDEYTRIFLFVPDIKNLFATGEFASITYHNLIIQRGPIIIFFMSLLQTVGISSQAFLFFTVFASLIINTIFFRIFSKYFFIAFLLYLVHGLIFKEWIGIKAGLISALLLPVIYFLSNKKNTIAIIITIVSSLIHYLAIIKIILFFLNRRFSRNTILSILFLSIFIEVLDVPYLVFSIFNNINYLPDYIFYYINSEAYGYDAGLFRAKTIQQIITLLLLLYLVHDNFLLQKDKYYNLLINSYVISTLALILFSFTAVLSNRINGLFIIVEPVLITYFIYVFSNKRTVSTILVIFALFVSYLNYIHLERISPYKFLIDKKDYLEHERIMDEIERDQLKI